MKTNSTEETPEAPIKTKYVTLEDGTDFRMIAKLMSESGYQMNHATARNVLMSALGSFLKNVSKRLGAEMSEAGIEEALKRQQVHESISDVLFDAYLKIEEERKRANRHGTQSK